MHDLDRTGHPGSGVCCGISGATSDSRRAIRRLSERLGITPVPLESMIDQLGKTAGNEYLRYRSGRMKHICRTPPGAAHLAGRDCRRQRKNLHYWYRLMQKARLAAPITEAQIRLAQGFLRELDRI
nr:DUF1198 domain-containing protein [Klebsiella pneumoniae subsp. pneumoniae]